MTVKDILTTVALLIDRKDILKYLQEGVSDNTADVISEIDSLVSCYNIVTDEIASEFYKFTYSEEFSVTKGSIKLSLLKYNPLSIISVETKNGKKANAKILFNEILCDNNEVVVNYYYLPKAKNIDDESEYTNTSVTSRVLAYGIATEYLLIKGAYEEASLWHQKFIDGLKGALSKTKIGKIKGRSFVW